MASSTGRKKGKSTRSGKSSGGQRKKSGARRVREERAKSLSRSMNAVLILIIFTVFATTAFYIWTILGRPGLPINRPADREACLELYFYDSTVTYIVPVHRKVKIAPNDSLTERAIREFAIGPKDPSLARVYPANIPIPGVKMDRKTAIIDLPAEIRGHWGGSWRETQFLDALTLTATSTGECSKVLILIAGAPQDATPEGIALDKPLERPKIFNKIPGSIQESETNWTVTYFLDSSKKYMIPVAIETRTSTDQALESVKALLTRPPSYTDTSLLPVVPSGYTLDRLTIENNHATIDIKIPDPQVAFMAPGPELFYSTLFLTLKHCCNIKKISVKLNGRPMESYEKFARFADFSLDECWNLERNPNSDPPTDNILKDSTA